MFQFLLCAIILILYMKGWLKGSREIKTPRNIYQIQRVKVVVVKRVGTCRWVFGKLYRGDFQMARGSTHYGR